MKKIPIGTGYYIDKAGRVYSDKIGNSKVKRKTLREKSICKSRGYFNVSLSINNKSRGYTIHYLLLITYRRFPKLKEVCRHLNGNPLDNRLENLKWGTYQENSNDRKIHGTLLRGKNHPMNKLEEEEVREIKKLGKKGKWRKNEKGGNYQEIAKNLTLHHQLLQI